MRLINDTLTAAAFVEILSSDDPKVSDECGGVNLELEVCLSGASFYLNVGGRAVYDAGYLHPIFLYTYILYYGTVIIIINTLVFSFYPLLLLYICL